jgi:EAL domain-containing protein (putative c-di-GMP-specific phosphodiesterase class I)
MALRAYGHVPRDDAFDLNMAREPFGASFAFQPIVDINTKSVFAYEALVRGRGGESAGSVLGAYSGERLFRFDRDAREYALQLAVSLVRDIDSKGPRQAIVKALIQACDDLGLEIIAEGVETEAEFRWFRRRGINLYQGYFIARPAFESLTLPQFPI